MSNKGSSGWFYAFTHICDNKVWTYLETKRVHLYSKMGRWDLLLTLATTTVDRNIFSTTTVRAWALLRIPPAWIKIRWQRLTARPLGPLIDNDRTVITLNRFIVTIVANITLRHLPLATRKQHQYFVFPTVLFHVTRGMVAIYCSCVIIEDKDEIPAEEWAFYVFILVSNSGSWYSFLRDRLLGSLRSIIPLLHLIACLPSLPSAY